MNSESNNMLTLPKAASLLGCSACTLRRYIKKGEGPAYTFLFSRYYFEVEDLQEWLKNSKVPGLPYTQIEKIIGGKK